MYAPRENQFSRVSEITILTGVLFIKRYFLHGTIARNYLNLKLNLNIVLRPKRELYRKN